jgi:hypothetical protein
MARSGRIHRDIGGESASDAVVARLAGRQHGVVARRQLRAVGLGDDAIDHRIAAGRLHPLHRGVFAVGHPVVSRAGAWMAAVLAAGPNAVLSHHAAAALWGIRETRRSTPDVIARRRVDRPRMHARRIVLASDETTLHRGIPVTTPARTLLDLAGTLTRQQLEAAITEAEINRLGSPTSLAALVARHPKGPGTANLRRILRNSADLGRTITRSDVPHLPRRPPPPAPAHERAHPARRRHHTDGRRRLARPPPHRRARQLRHPHHPPQLRAGPRPRPGAHNSGMRRRTDHLATAPPRPDPLAAQLQTLLGHAPTPTLKESARRPMTGPAPMDGCAEQPRDGRLYEPLP